MPRGEEGAASRWWWRRGGRARERGGVRGESDGAVVCVHEAGGRGAGKQGAAGRARLAGGEQQAELPRVFHGGARRRWQLPGR